MRERERDGGVEGRQRSVGVGKGKKMSRYSCSFGSILKKEAGQKVREEGKLWL